MNKLKNAIFLLLFSICGCGHALDSTSYPIKPTSQVACPSRDLHEFIKAFSENTEVQAAFTKYPLKVKILVDPTHEPKPKFSIKFLQKNQIHFPLLSGDTSLKNDGLITKVEKISRNSFIIIESSAGEKNLGHSVEYKFNKEDECWFLFEIIDYST